MIRTHIHMPEELLEKLKRDSENSGAPVAALIRRILEAHYKKRGFK